MIEGVIITFHQPLIVLIKVSFIYIMLVEEVERSSPLPPNGSNLPFAQIGA
jgi:hypothetical protein